MLPLLRHRADVCRQASLASSRRSCCTFGVMHSITPLVRRLLSPPSAIPSTAYRNGLARWARCPLGCPDDDAALYSHTTTMRSPHNFPRDVYDTQDCTGDSFCL